ncbi:MAG: type II secretion system protein [Acidobacteria bacterium]|nr:type II secretion system protein [Acidobacteriota bacterium]MBK8811700.1 type II secretion system protein [Acidobacteriota bacterium]
MKKRAESGFSIVELLLVVVIIGIVSAIGIPNFQKGMRSADNGTMYANLRSISSSQVSYYSQNGRFARLSELNALHGGSLGVADGNGLGKGKFYIEMSPAVPTDAELKNEYVIIASGFNGVGLPPISYRLNQTGEIVQLSP